jgi:hypothetical protein
MSFRDCIQTAIDSGRVTAGKGAEAHAAYDEAYDEGISAGLTEAEAVAKASDTAVEQITTLKAAKRWARINEMQRAHEIYTRLMGSKNPAEALDELMNDVELSYDTIRSIAMANLDRLMMTYKPKAGGLYIPERGLDDIARASYGDVRSPQAQDMYEQIFASQETLRKWANRYGASIPENKNRRLAQSHEQVKVSNVPEAEWVDEHLDALDWEIMRFEGKEVAPEGRREVLGRVYRGIVNDGAGRGNPAQQQTPSLANRMSRDRFLYYKDAESWIAMQKKYGSGNVYEQTIGLIDKMAVDISLLKHFGPGADSMKEFAKRVGRERAAEINETRKPGKKTAVQDYDKFAVTFDEMYDVHARRVASLEGNFAMQTWATARTVAVTAKLGGVFIPTVFGDIANAKVARQMVNMPEISVIRQYMKDFVPTEENISEAIQLGVIFENGISLAFNRQRYFGALDGPRWARRFSDATYRLGLAAHATQVGRNASGKQFLGLLANYSTKEWDDLQFQPFLTEHGITKEDWDVFRSTPLYEKGKAKFLRPIDAFKIEGREAVAEKFQNAMQMYVRTAIPEPTLRSRVAMGEATNPNSVYGQTIRTVTSLMSFPVAIYFNQLHRIAKAPRIRDKLKLGMMYFTWMTAGGAMITQAKALANGQQLYNMTGQDENGDFDAGVFTDFWGRAFLNGGSLGILGDLVFNNINMSNSSYRPGNPTEEYFKAAHKLTVDNMIDAGHAALYEAGLVKTPGDELNLTKDTLKFIDANVPDLWYLKLVMQRALTDHIFEEGDPAGWARYQRYLQEHEEGMWWEPGGEPDNVRLETAVGG